MINKRKSALQELTTLAFVVMLPLSCQVVEQGFIESTDPNFRLVKLYYENSTGEVAITTYFYNTRGENYMAHWQLEDSSRSSVNFYEYDSLGNQIRKYREFSDGLTSDQHFSHDLEGRLAGQDFSSSDGVKGKTSYEYDDRGRCLAARCEGLNGWFHGDLIFTYDAEDTKMGAGIYRGQDSIGFIEYNYDYFGNLKGEYWDFNGEWTQAFIYEYQQEAAVSFTSSNVFIRESKWFRVKEENYTYNDETSGPSYFNFGDDGRLVEKEFIRSDGLTTRTSYTYDSTGILRSSLREYHDGLSAIFHYWYSIERKLLVRTFESSDSIGGSETYRYDDNGMLLSGELDNFDNWLNGTIKFGYDETGLLQTGKLIGQDGFDADLQFEYDLNQNLKSINWDFSFGGFQKYSFTYEPL